MRERRYIHIYTGEGKGKTTAAIGLCIRAIGAGWKVLFTQFLKHGQYSEIKTLKRLEPQITVHQFGVGKFVKGKPSKEEIEKANAGLEFIKQQVVNYDLIVLDEINVAIHFNVISLDKVVNFIKNKPKSTELVLTGRWAKQELIELADLVTEMRPIKHYFQNGVKSRVGIEK